MKRRTKRRIIYIGLILFIIFLVSHCVSGIVNFFNVPSSDQKRIDNHIEEKYKTIKLDNNSNYAGIGQKQVSDKDGYFTTFTDLDNKTYKEYKQNGKSSWAQNNYWDGTMDTSGCGITAMSIILSGYGLDYTPEDLRKKYFPVLDGEKISYELSHTFNISNSDFCYDQVRLSEKNINKYLSQNKPILICVWNKPTENRWTTASHYLVLLATDNNGMVYVSNPNGLHNNSKSSGWYEFNEIGPYIAKALFITK